MEEKEHNRGMTKYSSSKRMNFFFIWGCNPSAGVKANTSMVKDILKACMRYKDVKNAAIFLPQVFDFLQSNDASFETAQSAQIQTIQLFYNYNVATHSIGVVFYHNYASVLGLDDRLQNSDKYDLVEPSRQMLKIALELDRVHTFGDMSPSQINEKLDWLAQISMRRIPFKN